MSKQWQIRRGTSAENNEFTGAQGEITMDTDKNQIRLHDGVTQGGIPFGDTVIEWQAPTAENNYTWYRKYRSGWIEQGGYYYNGTSVSGAHNISFPVPFANTNYQSLLSVLHNIEGGSPNDISEVFPSRTTTTMKIYVRAGWCGYVWQVTGIAA